jgi:hypothetical protein
MLKIYKMMILELYKIFLIYNNMKYLKLFEDKEKDKEIIDTFKICFQDLEDNGFEVKIFQILVNWYADFSESPILNAYKRSSQDQPKIHYFRIDINKNEKSFNITNIKEDILFTEAYMKGEFNLNIDHIRVLSWGKWAPERIYKSIEYIPLDIKINSVVIAFTKNKDI